MQEWEFLLLTKLDWDLSAVIAPDYVEHILQRLVKLDLVLDQGKKFLKTTYMQHILQGQVMLDLV